MCSGVVIGIVVIVGCGMRCLIELIKEAQVDCEKGMVLDMGQWLSIPFVLLGIGLLVYSYKKKIPAAAVIPDTKPKKAEPTHYAKSLNG